MANPAIKWKVIEHSLSKVRGKHVILVAYQPRSPTLNQVLGIAPLYDLRDADLDGWVSWREWAYGWYYPYTGMGDLAAATDRWSCVNDVARQMKDYVLWQQALGGMLKAAFEVCAVAQTTMLVDQVLAPGVQLTLARTALSDMGKAGGVVQFMVEKSMRWVLLKALTWSRHRANSATGVQLGMAG